MPRYAQPVCAPAARKASSLAVHRPPNRTGPQRSAKWHAIQLQAAQSAAPTPAARTQNSSGLPPRLKAGVEHLSGIAMDEVRVHRNSPEPAKVGALAYARGSEIHLGPGQEKHLPHEAWHVVQQAQGRVKATMQTKTGVAVNDDASLEREADMMGGKAAALPEPSGGWRPGRELQQAPDFSPAVAQREGMDVVATEPEPDELADEYHEEDNIEGNAEEELVPGDLVVSDIDTSQHQALGVAVAARHPNDYQEFAGLVGSSAYATATNFLTWFNSGVMTRHQIRAAFMSAQQTQSTTAKPMQMARGAGDSYQAHYDSTSHGAFTKVTYVRNTKGAIDFAAVKSGYTKWKNPVKSGSEVQLNKGSGNTTHGITLNGTKVKIAGASRGTHFSIANRIMKNGAGSASPDGWTWHHLPAKYRMVLVDRRVHSKHGHNGGVYLWT